MTRWPEVGLVFALCLPAPEARADDAPRWEPGERTTSRMPGEIEPSDRPYRGDGVYDRLDGDFDLGLALGAEADRTGASLALRASAHYFGTAGLYVSYVDALGGQGHRSSRLVAVGVEVRPLFLARFATNQSQGPAWLDLFVDSFALSTGAYFAEPAGRDFGDRKGVELSLGLGLPLAGSAWGPWLLGRGIARLPEAPRDDGTQWALVALLGWHAPWASPLISN